MKELLKNEGRLKKLKTLHLPLPLMRMMRESKAL